MRLVALVVTMLSAMLAASATLTNGVPVTHTEFREVKVNGQWRVIKIVVVDRKTRQAVREMQVHEKVQDREIQGMQDYLHRGLVPTLRSYGLATKAETLAEADGRYMPKTANPWDWDNVLIMTAILAIAAMVIARYLRQRRRERRPA